ncbi:MAG TPA: glycoside hydrolase family 3 C-terminal domain-containing protein, partial [Thermotogota bacterium]|nr:glycoside hydrolase family 3 C-terminal domain-containing protein [Thermotogota bacterium]
MKRSLKALSVWVILLALCGMTVAASLSDQISSREIKNAELSRSIAAQGMVLLENNGVLPLSAGKVALFGGGAVKTVKGGTGSGDVNQRYVVSVREGFENAGFELTSEDWLDRYKAAFEKGEAEWEGGWFTVFSMEDIEVTDTDIAAAKEADMAVYVIARNSGEGSDRDSGKGDYLLTDIEYNNLKTLGENFENVVVVLNVGGIVDTKFFNEIGGLDSLLLMSQAGMEGGNAVVDILTGKVTPSGKLTDTWAVNYSDYQSSKGFSSNDGNTDYEIYNDGIYVGY